MVTLTKPGFLIPPAWEKDKEKFADTIPIEYIVNFIARRVPSSDSGTVETPATKFGDKVVVIKAKTASGKSTAMPYALYKRFFESTQKNIACLQPRVMNTVTIPIQVTKFAKDMIIGRNIGYQTGNFVQKPSYRGLIYMTTGVFLQQLRTLTDAQIIDMYSFIIIDECHDRNIALDLTMYSLKKFLERNYRNPKCPLVICTSATFDEHIYMKYFDTEYYIEVEGSSYPIKDNFLLTSTSSYMDTIMTIIDDIHKSDPPGVEEIQDILVFFSGGAEIKELKTRIEKLNDKTLLPLSLTSDVVNAQGGEYRNVYSKMPDVRRVISSTNVAETGVTIDTIKYVIDSGYYNSSEFNPIYGVGALIMKPIHQGSAMQRRGRAGRKAPGFWYPLYSKDTFDMLSKEAHPEIYKTDISLDLLNIIIQESDLPIVHMTEISKLDVGGELVNNTKTGSGEELCPFEWSIPDDIHKVHVDRSEGVVGGYVSLDRILDKGRDTLKSKTGVGAYHTKGKSADAKKTTSQLEDGGTEQEYKHASTPWDEKRGWGEDIIEDIKGGSDKDKKDDIVDRDSKNGTGNKTINLLKVDLMSLPSSDSIQYSLDKLYKLGAISPNVRATKLGYAISKFRKISVESIKMILSGYVYGACITDLVFIAAFLATGDIYSSREKGLTVFGNDYQKMQILLADEFIEPVLVFKMFEESDRSDKWFEKKGVSYGNMMRILELRDELLKDLIGLGFNPFQNSHARLCLPASMDDKSCSLDVFYSKIKSIKLSIYEGYKINLLEYKVVDPKQPNGDRGYFYNDIRVGLRSNLISNKVGDINPRYIVANQSVLFINRNTGIYNLSGTYISIMDGYVDVDA